jgi:hypothetical protein
MNKGTKILVWTVALLVLCNIGLILAIWLKPGAGDKGKHETPRDYVIRNLDMADEQVDKYDVLIHAHRQAMHGLRDEAMQYRRILFSGIGNKNNPVNADSIAQLIAEAQKRIEIVTYEHFAQVREICTDAQKPVFDNIINDVIKKMNGGMRPPLPDRERHGDGPPPHGRPGPTPPDDRP